MLPDGYTLAPQDRLSDELKEETEGIYFTQYSDDQPNILLVGPLPGDEHQELVFPILAPDPKTDSSISYGKTQIHVGGNRGRGQVYPTGEKSNNTVYTASVAGDITAITGGDAGASVVTIAGADGNVEETIPAGPALVVAVGDSVDAGEALTDDPNVVVSAKWMLKLCFRTRAPLRPAWLPGCCGHRPDHAGAEEEADREGSGRRRRLSRCSTQCCSPRRCSNRRGPWFLNLARWPCAGTAC